MSIQGLMGIKGKQTKIFVSETGERIPVTNIMVGTNRVITVWPKINTDYQIVRLGFGIKRNSNKPLLGQIKGAGLKTAPSFLKEFKAEGNDVFTAGEEIKAVDVFKIGDKVKVTGVSKGRGFAGVVKRYGFKGGPKTHGQSDRLRAPGSSGSTTTPGRLYKGKKMSGRMGGRKVTIKGLKIVGIVDEKNEVTVKGLIPGSIGGLVQIFKES